MGFLRQKSDSTISIERNIDEVFSALVKAGAEVGKVKDKSKLAGYVVIKTKMKLFPPKNPATVRVNVKKIDDNNSEISFNSDSFDGAIGFDSAGTAIDSIIKELEKILT